MKYNVLIAGAGQLGSRYLQGLINCRNPLAIFVSDVSPDSLVRAEARWHEAGGGEGRHELQVNVGFEHVPQHLDIAIVATNADVRIDVVRAIASRAGVDYWILEKILAQSEDGIEQLNDLIGSNSRAWVNTPRRAMSWYKELKKISKIHSPVNAEVSGGHWALGCNAIHFLDFLAWLSGEALVDVSTQSLDKIWYPAKRDGFWEVQGKMTAKFSGGSEMSLICDESDRAIQVTLRDANSLWSIDERQGVAQRSDGLAVRGHLEYQSSITAGLIDSILDTGQCGLPSLRESSALHLPLIRALSAHWNGNMPNQLSYVPIT